MLLNLEQIGKSFGEKVVLEHVTASVEREDRIGIVGQNGAGKTTLLKILTGEYTDYTGEFSLTHGVTVGYLAQNAKLDATLDVYGEMRSTFAPVLDAMAQMQVVEQRNLVVEKLRIHRPAPVSAHQLVPDQIPAEYIDRLPQRELSANVPISRKHIAHAFIGRGQRPVHGRDDRREPAFLDRAPFGAQRIIVIGVQPEAKSRTAEPAGHKNRHKAENTLTLFECLFDFHGD